MLNTSACILLFTDINVISLVDEKESFFVVLIICFVASPAFLGHVVIVRRYTALHIKKK